MYPHIRYRYMKNNNTPSKLIKEKRLRGVPLYFDEVKVSMNLSISPSVKTLLKQEAKDKSMSVSQMIEDEFRIKYGLLTLEEAIAKKTT